MSAPISSPSAPDLSALPSELRAAFEHALALFDALPTGHTADDRLPVRNAIRAAMAALGLPKFEPFKGPDGGMVGYTRRPVVTAEALTDAQRAVLLALVDRSDLLLGEFPVPCTAWARRQWLGLAPPDPLWMPGSDGAPRYFDLRARLAADRQALKADLASLPVAEQVPLLFELDLVMGDFWGDQGELIQSAIGKLDADLGPWATAAAERVLAGVEKAERVKLDHGRSQLVFAALVKAGLPIDARREPLLRLHRPSQIALLDDWIGAISEDRREAAVLAALEHLSFVDERVRMAAHLLPRWPFVGLALYAEANLKDCRTPKDVRQVLKAVSETDSPIKDALAAWKKAQPKPLKLKVISSAKLADLLPLDALQAAQLEAAAREYNGAVCSSEDIIAGRCEADEPILPHSIEYTRLEGPRSKPAIDLWAMMGDSGTFFRAGTTEVLARICQFDVDCDDSVLQAALQLALRGA